MVQCTRAGRPRRPNVHSAIHMHGVSEELYVLQLDKDSASYKCVYMQQANTSTITKFTAQLVDGSRDVNRLKMHYMDLNHAT